MLRGALWYAGWLSSIGRACAQAPDSARSTLDKACPLYAPAASVPPAARDSLPLGIFLSPTKERWVQLAREVPGGFGGIIDEGGVPITYLVDTGQHRDAVAALVAEGVLKKTEETRVRGARWDFAQLYDWYRYLTLHVELPGRDVVAWGIDEGQNRLYFAMLDEPARRRFERALARLHLPCFLVTLQVTGRVVPQ
jgi:hypothetical protein